MLQAPHLRFCLLTFHLFGGVRVGSLVLELFRVIVARVTTIVLLLLLLATFFIVFIGSVAFVVPVLSLVARRRGVRELCYMLSCVISTDGFGLVCDERALPEATPSRDDRDPYDERQQQQNLLE